MNSNPNDFEKNEYKKMGGYCSGRVGWHAKCENLLSIDVRQWVRKGCLGRHYFGWTWTFRDGQKSSIGVWGHPNHVELGYTKDGEKYRYPVQLTKTNCHLGGQRQWFRCPITGCDRRSAKLYLGDKYFGCRRCYRLVYQSQCYGPHDRAMVQAGKIRLRLGGYEGTANPFPKKPKRMRWRTYEDLRDRCWRYEGIADQRLDWLIARFATKYG